MLSSFDPDDNLSATENYYFVLFRVIVIDIKKVMMMIVKFRPYCQVWRLGPLDLTH